MTNSTFLTRVVLQDYRSIASCDVALSPLTFLVGPNGAGKSNFLDALRLVTHALYYRELDQALQARNGAAALLRRGATSGHFALRLEFRLPEDTPQLLTTGSYALSIAPRAQGGYAVEREQLILSINGADPVGFLRHGSLLRWIGTPLWQGPPPVPAAERLSLSTLEQVSPHAERVVRALSRMTFYHPELSKLRGPRQKSNARLLARDGSNLVNIYARLSTPVRERVEAYLAKILPGLTSVSCLDMLDYQALEFHQQLDEAGPPQIFSDASMSDGTLRALGTLVALLQTSPEEKSQVPLVGLEEPELALHPAAAGVLRSALLQTSAHTQVLITSHSPDLLDDKEVDNKSLLAVRTIGGVTHVGSLDEVGRSALADQLYTAGELLRLNQLLPSPESPTAPRIFDEELSL